MWLSKALLKLTTVWDDNTDTGSAIGLARFLNFPDDLQSFHHSAKNHMLAIQPGRKKNQHIDSAAFAFT